MTDQQPELRGCVSFIAPIIRAINWIIGRYGLLFPPRTLACRRCLGIRYGEMKTK